jgi:hypothetical protein
MLLPILFRLHSGTTFQVTASATDIIHSTFEVSAGDHILVTFPEPYGFAFISTPSSYFTHVSQSCTDPCSSSCASWYTNQPGVIYVGGKPGVVDFYVQSAGTYLVRATYTGFESSPLFPSHCTDVFVNDGTITINQTLISNLTFFSCFFSSEAAQPITGIIRREGFRFTNAGRSGFSSKPAILRETYNVTGLLVKNEQSLAGDLAGNLTFTSSSSSNSGSYHYFLHDQTDPTPRVAITGDHRIYLTSGQDATYKYDCSNKPSGGGGSGGGGGGGSSGKGDGDDKGKKVPTLTIVIAVVAVVVVIALVGGVICLIRKKGGGGWQPGATAQV